MKKTIFIAIMMIFTLSATTTFARKSESKSIAPAATENKLSAEELSRLNTRAEEIRSMDKSNMTVTEKSELRKESKSIKENIKRSGGGYVYIGGGTLLLVLLIILLI
jgi:peptidoglycan hydrolase CwlO-like protein